MTEIDAGTSLELAAAAHVDGLVFGDPAKHIFGVARVGLDLAALVAEHGAVVCCRRAGGNRVGWQLAARLTLELYAGNYTDAYNAQDALEGHLADRWRPTPDGALRIDSWRSESAATPTMYPDLHLLLSTWRITSRDLPD